tara:strand:- start:1757 stop:1966 length:210 start_codon:yes stop_codon:yes gene_type:complete
VLPWSNSQLNQREERQSLERKREITKEKSFREILKREQSNWEEVNSELQCSLFGDHTLDAMISEAETVK